MKVSCDVLSLQRWHKTNKENKKTEKLKEDEMTTAPVCTSYSTHGCTVSICLALFMLSE
jgi:hypothetical protein